MRNQEKKKEYMKVYRQKNKDNITQKGKEWRENNKEKISLQSKKNWQENKEMLKEKIKKYRQDNKEKIALQSKKYQEENAEKYKQLREQNKEKKKEYDKKNKEKVKEKRREYIEQNKERINSQAQVYKKQRSSVDPAFKLSMRINSIIRLSLKNNGYGKKSKTYQILGCSYTELKNHIEKQFEPWMNWENHGKYNGEFNYGWDIDHITPISSAMTEAEVIQLNHYTNLQPLCSKVNRYIKKDNLDWL